MDPKFEIFIFLIIIAFDLYQFIQMYIIRKTKNSTKITGGGVSSMLIPLGLIVLVLLVGSIIEIIKQVKHIPTDSEGSPIIGIIVGLVFLGVLISIYNSTSKYKKAKEFKGNGGGIIKRVKITSIEKYNRNENGQNIFDGNYLQAIDGNMIYCSDAFEGATVTGTSNEKLREIYTKYGFEYDEKYKDQILNKINESQYNTGELTIKKFLGGVINNFVSELGFNTIEAEKEILEQGFQQQKLEINGHTIAVGDSVDVYIDPEDQENYWMDIDFLLQK